MTNKNEHVDKLLRNADPASRLPLPTFKVDPLEAAKSAGKNKTFGSKFKLMSSKARRSLFAGSLATVAAAAAVAFALPSVLSPQSLIELGANPEYNQSSSKIGSADSMLAPIGAQEFEAASSLSTETGTGHVYELSLAGSPRSRLKEIAAVFGVIGDVKKQDSGDEDNLAYLIGDENYTSPNVSIYWSGTGGWSYFSGSNGAAVSKSATNGTPEDGAVSVPEQKNMPSKASAIAEAVRIFSATGLQVSNRDVTYFSDEWSTYVSANLKVDGFDTALEWNVSWGSDGKINSAYGQSATVIDRGEYATISATDAVAKRMADFRWTGQLPTRAYSGVTYRGGIGDVIPGADESGVEEPKAVPSTGDGAPSVVDPSGTDSSGAGSSATEPSTGTVEPAPMPMPTRGDPVDDSVPTLSKITITKATLTLLTIYDANGKAWLVPGFEMSDSKYWLSGVVSLIDGVIELPKITEMGIESK
jgi:hypothetical protein